MQTLIIAVSKPTLTYARAGVALYEERLRALGKVEVKYVKEGSAEEVAESMLRASEGCLRIALDERGENLSTRELEIRWREWQMRAVKRVAFLVGPADGHAESLRAACDRTLSLGRHTMQHELALVVLLEQVYRIHTLLAGSPYHRD